MADRTLSTEQGVVDLSIPTNSDLSSDQYRFVRLDSSEEVVGCGANEWVLGILQNDPNGSSTEKIATVRVQGISKLKINETVAAGDWLTPVSTGLGEIADAADEECGAVALSSGDQNDLIQTLVIHGKSHSTYA